MIGILSANLGHFDNSQDPKFQENCGDWYFHRYTDEDFPPITGLSPRLQYRIPKCFGWQMLPGADAYIWMDGGISFRREDCAKYYLDQLGDGDICLFVHPNRSTIREEVEHIEDHIRRDKPYIVNRYKGGLHREFLTRLQEEGYVDDRLYASTTFIYRNTPKVQKAMEDWWMLGSRYFTCDQVQLPYVLKRHDLDVRVFDQPIFKTGYMSLVSHHK